VAWLGAFRRQLQTVGARAVSGGKWRGREGVGSQLDQVVLPIVCVIHAPRARLDSLSRSLLVSLGTATVQISHVCVIGSSSLFTCCAPTPVSIATAWAKSCPLVFLCKPAISAAPRALASSAAFHSVQLQPRHAASSKSNCRGHRHRHQADRCRIRGWVQFTS
jgi:hypothetical protein